MKKVLYLNYLQLAPWLYELEAQYMLSNPIAPLA